jgi:D-arginine dehydrogenase
MQRFDFAVIGAGIAGASFAARVAGRSSVLLLEREPIPGYHTTGRSAALFNELYGNEVIRALTRASRAFYDAPPDGFSRTPLLTRRGALHVGFRNERGAPGRAAYAAPAQSIGLEEALERVSVLRPSELVWAALDAGARDIDVHSLHQGFLRAAKVAGAQLVTGAELIALQRMNDWRITTRAGSFRAAVVVNAAGAWADRVAGMAGVEPLGLKPLRRTVITIDAPAAAEAGGWPAVLAADEAFYFKPAAGRLLATPADETPSEPCDAQPEELDIAVCVDRLERATLISVRRVLSSWAGLRTFAGDRTPVVGYDPRCAAFFWLAGQGGYGIQTAPALSEVAAALALREPVPAHVRAEGFDAGTLRPQRLRP